MAGEWVEMPLGDVITLQRGFDLPSHNRTPGKVPIVSSSGISDYHSEVAVKGPGVVTGRYGTIGQVFFIKEDYWPLNTTLWVKDFHGNDPRFASYLLRTIDFLSCSDKSSVPGVNRNDLHRIPVLIPPLAQQKAIAAILGALEEKIELNRQMNTTLESMARALFRNWFVDFAPVRDKLDGRTPAALDAATAELSPGQLEDSPVGHIPKGWKACPLAELLVVVKGRSYRSEELAESKTALVTLKSFLRGGGYRADGLKSFTGEYKPNQRVWPGDLVVAFTDVTQAADIIGKPALIRSDDRFETLVASLDVGIIRPTSKHVSIPFLYCLFLTEEFQAHAYSHATGTTVLHLGSAAIPSFVSVVPPVEIAEKFAERTAPIFRLIDENAKQSRTLAALRDMLLPKLVSGELSICRNPS
jgi:type I restriction enzyme S subunit